MLFITIQELKSKLGVSSISIRKSKSTGKTYADYGNGKLKVEGNIDETLPLKFIYESEDLFDKGCIVNIRPVEDLFTL